MNEQPEPNKLCPILMLCPPKTGREPSCETYGDIVCLQDKCAMWHPAVHVVVPESPPAYEYDITGYCGLAGKP